MWSVVVWEGELHICWKVICGGVRGWPHCLREWKEVLLMEVNRLEGKIKLDFEKRRGKSLVTVPLTGQPRYMLHILPVNWARTHKILPLIGFLPLKAVPLVEIRLHRTWKRCERGVKRGGDGMGRGRVTWRLRSSTDCAASTWVQPRTSLAKLEYNFLTWKIRRHRLGPASLPSLLFWLPGLISGAVCWLASHGDWEGVPYTWPTLNSWMSLRQQ
jgi:hypothetical protein